MTDRPDDRPDDQPDDRPLTPAEEERVRRLLADARHAEPMPGDVVARLDAVLAGLAAEGIDGAGSGADGATDGADGRTAVGAAAGAGRPDEATGAPVADLAAVRRRRRRLTQVLVAAAAVTVVGVTGPQLLGGAGDMMTAESGSTSAGDAGGADAAAESAPQSATAQDGDTEDDVGGGYDSSAGEEPRSLAAPGLTRGSLRTEAERLRETGPAPEASGSSALQKSAVSACRDGAAWGPGRRVLVTFDGADAVLVYRPVADGVQPVDLFLCGDDTPTQTLSLPAP